MEMVCPKAQLASLLRHWPCFSPQDLEKRREGLVFPKMLTAGEVQPRQIQSLPPPWRGLASRLPQQLLWAVSPVSLPVGPRG